MASHDYATRRALHEVVCAALTVRVAPEPLADYLESLARDLRDVARDQAAGKLPLDLAAEAIQSATNALRSEHRQGCRRAETGICLCDRPAAEQIPERVKETLG